MSQEIEESLANIHQALGSILSATTAKSQRELGLVLEIDHELQCWLDVLPIEVSSNLEVAKRELNTSLYLASVGFYRQSFASLRLFLELSLASVYFSTHEVERRRWLNDTRDVSWSELTDSSEGVFSEKFTNAFDPSLTRTASYMLDKAKTVYKRCSQYVHGKPLYSEQLPSVTSHDIELFESWFHLSIKAGNAVLFLLVVRYGEILPDHETLSESVLDRFRSAEIRKKVGVHIDQ